MKAILENRGFTLVELLVYLGMVSVIVLVFNSIVVDVVRNSARAIEEATVAQNCRFILGRIGQEIKTAQSTAVSLDHETLTATRNDGTTAVYEKSLIATQLASDSIEVFRFSATSTGNMIEISLGLKDKKSNNPVMEPYSLLITSFAQQRRGLY